MKASILTASHYGVVRFCDLECAAVVLPGGQRGYVGRQLARLFGFGEMRKGGRFAGFLTEFAPGCLSILTKSRDPILLPSKLQAQFFPAGIIGDAASALIDLAINGALDKARQAIVPNCMKIVRALAASGELALIDEATGYQYQRAPQRLQEFISKLSEPGCVPWDQLFAPDYYHAIYRLFGSSYQGRAQEHTFMVDMINRRWVYGPVLHARLIDEIRACQGISQQHRQWLAEQGLARLEAQIHAVTAIARSCNDCHDFERRCKAAFSGGCPQSGLFADETGEVA